MSAAELLLKTQLEAAGLRVTPSGLVRSEVCAVELGVTPGTLRNMRYHGEGPQWIVIRGRCWYELRAICDYNERNSRDPFA